MSCDDGWRQVPSTGSIPGFSVFTRPVEKSDPDDRDYRIVRLENGLQAILVHDPSADKAAACLTIAVGSLYDPDDVPGLAHFCEHMLSKGSKPYPEENDFLSFISSNGGTRNAATGGSYQDYWFSIKPSLLSQALPRLAAFFHSPLFYTNLTSREIHAVDSENKRNLQNDARRIFQLGKSLSLPGHRWRKFGTGNYASLTEAARKKVEEGLMPDPNSLLKDDTDDEKVGPVERETRRRLVEWWEKEYCAGRMTLAVVGKGTPVPLDELTELTVPLFSSIPNRGLDPRPSIIESPWGPQEMGSVVFAKTVKDYFAFSLEFLLPDQINNFRTQPSSILAHFVGHEGPGSICAYLKKQGWLVDLSAGMASRNREVHIFRIEGELTREGYRHYEDVVLTIFNYLNILRDSVFEPYHFSEINTMSKVSFRFREKSQPHTFASSVAYNLSEPWPPEWIFSAKVIRDWDEELVRDTLRYLTPERGRVMVMAKEHDPLVVRPIGDLRWETERWYGTEYYVKRLEDGFFERANKPNANTELFLPRPNPYIPDNLTVEKYGVSEPLKYPLCIRETPLSSLWFKKDDQYWVPKGHIKVDIGSTLAYATPRHAILTRLLADLLEDDLSEVTYDAQLAGLGYSVSNHRGGLIVSVSGYNDKLGTLLDTVVRRLVEFEVKPDRLKVISEQARREYENFYIRQPSLLADHYASRVLVPQIWTVEEKLAELEDISETEIERHRQELISKVFIQALVTGNIKEQQAIQIVESLEKRLGSRSIPPSQRPQDRSLLLPPGSNFIFPNDLTDPKELNSSLTYFCQFGDVADAKLRPILRWIVHAIREPTFSQLRTVEQLGYIVVSWLWSSSGSMGLGFKIQSLKHPMFLEERLEKFLIQYHDKLEEMSTEDFEARKDGLVIKLLERSKNLREETSGFWSHIRSGYQDFLQSEADAEAVKTLQLVDVLGIYKQLVHPLSKNRKKLSAHVLSQQLDASARSAMVYEGLEEITDEALFKAKMCCSPAPTPVLRTTPASAHANQSKAEPSRL